MAAEPNAVEQAVTRTLRDNLDKIQRNADELHQAVNDHGFCLRQQPCEQRVAGHDARSDLRCCDCRHAGSLIKICYRLIATPDAHAVRIGDDSGSSDQRAPGGRIRAASASAPAS